MSKLTDDQKNKIATIKQVVSTYLQYKLTYVGALPNGIKLLTIVFDQAYVEENSGQLKKAFLAVNGQLFAWGINKKAFTYPTFIENGVYDLIHTTNLEVQLG